MVPIIGIDLGTSNSAAAVLRGGRPAIIPSAERDGRVLVGEPARRQAVTQAVVTVPVRITVINPS